MATEAQPSIAIRVDGGTQVGSGHVIRCLTLAGELVHNGACVTFICRDLPGYLGGLIEREGHPVVRLRAPSAPVAGRDAGNSSWLQVPWSQDCEETREVLARVRPQWLIVDHYGIGEDWERAQRPWTKHILVVDDLADRAHDCDVLVDQNYFGPGMPGRYNGLVPQHCRLLLGPRYAILQRDYAHLHRLCMPRTGEARRVLVFFGGSDATDETSKALRALGVPELAHLAVDVVLGANHPAPDAVAALASQRPGTALHRDLPTLAGLMFRADLAVGAGGAATAERLCLGLPSVVVTLADNQEAPIASLAGERAVIWAGRSGSVSVADLAAAISRGVRTHADVPRLADGLGSKRVSATIMPPLPDRLRLRRARIGDAGLLFDWRNDPLVREMSFDRSPIAWASHLDWLKSKLEDRNAEIAIGEVDGLPVGHARLDFQDGEALLSYGVDADLRGLGFGRALVKEAMHLGRRGFACAIRAHVKAENAASRKIFQGLGWRETIVGAEHIFRHPR